MAFEIVIWRVTKDVEYRKDWINSSNEAERCKGRPKVPWAERNNNLITKEVGKRITSDRFKDPI